MVQLVIDLEGVVKAIEEPAQHIPERQLHDLCFGEMPSKSLKQAVRDPLSVVRNGNCVLDDETVDIVEAGIVFEIRQSGNRLVCNALNLQRLCVMGDAIVTFVQLRRGYDCKLDVAPVDTLQRFELHQKAHQMRDGGGDVRKHCNLVPKWPIALREFFVDVCDAGRKF